MSNEAKSTENKETPTEKFNPKWLAGLTFKGATAKKVKEDGRERLRHVPFERPLKESDVLSWREEPTEVVIVTADGRKYRVRK